MAFVGFDSYVLSSGLWVIWDPNVVQKDNSVLNARHISIFFFGSVDGFKWGKTNVYGPNRPDERAQFFDELNALTNFVNVPWCIGGDFNVIRWPIESSVNPKISPCMRMFNSFIQNNELLDILSIGVAYTWSKHVLSDPTFTHLDRFLVTNAFFNKFPNLYVKALVKIASDHVPIQLNSMGMKFGPSPFRMELNWLSNRSFIKLVEEVWQNTKIEGCVGHQFLIKLKMLKNEIFKWKKESWGNLQ
ncbi:hypothetical protein AMTRI_Chr02g214030 [Amborella trichopoda]